MHCISSFILRWWNYSLEFNVFLFDIFLKKSVGRNQFAFWQIFWSWDLIWILNVLLLWNLWKEKRTNCHILFAYHFILLLIIHVKWNILESWWRFYHKRIISNEFSKLCSVLSIYPIFQSMIKKIALLFIWNLKSDENFYGKARDLYTKCINF